MCNINNKISPEDLAYWYFRLNGFFTILNFIVHPDKGMGQRTDVDIFGVRFPYRSELLCDPMVDSEEFLEISKPYIVIVEVKKDRCGLNGPWTKKEKENMQRVLRALGVFKLDIIDNVAKSLYENGYFENEVYYVSLFCVGKRENPEYLKQFPKVPQLTWEKVAHFIYNRFSKYREQKYSHSQWDNVGKKIWDLFEQSKNEEEYLKKILHNIDNY